MKLTVYISNCTASIEEQLSEFQMYCEIEVINIDDSPEQAVQANIWVTPTVIINDGIKKQRLNYYDRATLLASLRPHQAA